MAYFLDADVFIRAKNLHYGFDFCPAFWEWLIRQNKIGRLYSIERVGEELLAGTDELADRARERGERLLLIHLMSRFSLLWKRSVPGLPDRITPRRRVSTFFQVADYYLVAQAYTGQHTVVTHEVTSGSRRKIKIPDACIGLGIKCVTPFEMLRRERARFVLGPSPGA